MNKEKRVNRPKKTDKNSNAEFVVTEPCGLLDFLLLKLTRCSRNNVKSLLKYKEVSVDGQIISKYDYNLKPRQTVKITSSINRGEKQKNTMKIIYEDDDLIVINKPAGLLSISTDKEKEITAYHYILDYVKKSNPKGRIFAVHRLDRETSGVLMVAKNEKIKLALQENWADLVSERSYIAVVEGRLSEKSGRIKSWLKETKALVMYSSKKDGEGLEAITNYEVVSENLDYSLLRIKIETGRKNQIRVHMCDLGHPVVGDEKYGAKTNPLKRLALHADKLVIEHPFTHKKMCFESEIPKSFLSLFKGVNQNKNFPNHCKDK